MEPVLRVEDETSNCLLWHVGNYLYYQPLAPRMRQNCFNGSGERFRCFFLAVGAQRGPGFGMVRGADTQRLGLEYLRIKERLTQS